MPSLNRGGAVLFDVSLGRDELAKAWQPDTRRLVLTAPEPIRAQQRIAARITAAGMGVTATITGRVVSARTEGTLHRIELAPDETRLPAVERLVAIARGKTIDRPTRTPRFLAAVPVVVFGPAGPTYMTTFSISPKGCGLAWSGPVPAVGARVDVRLPGNRAASLGSVVCWTGRSGHTAMVGLRFVSGALGAWSTMVDEVQRSGAPIA
ncbi:MAG TPA: PilZ domain-containing protein [Anaeromyxobacter sp.]|nr:PilZ domain-containing protein [Anaeromyxobacter sp.]